MLLNRLPGIHCYLTKHLYTIEVRISNGNKSDRDWSMLDLTWIGPNSLSEMNFWQLNLDIKRNKKKIFCSFFLSFLGWCSTLISRLKWHTKRYRNERERESQILKKGYEHQDIYLNIKNLWNCQDWEHIAEKCS